MADQIPWTQFYDRHSGGGSKESDADGREISKIYIQAPRAEAEIVFYNRFGHPADRISCTCCGEEYSVTQLEDGVTPAKWRERALEEGYGEKDENVLEIAAEQITASERVGAVPTSGWVWQD